MVKIKIVRRQLLGALILAISFGSLSGCIKNAESAEVKASIEESSEETLELTSELTPEESSEVTLNVGVEAATDTEVNIETESHDTQEESEKVRIGLDLPVSRAMAAKMLALAYYDRISINTMEREITFTDTAPEMWYDKYINAVYMAGLMSGSEDNTFMPEQPLTILQAEYLLAAVDPGHQAELAPNEELKAQPIAYSLWAEALTQAFTNAAQGDLTAYFGLETISAVPLTTADGKVITDTGSLSSVGENMEPLIDKRISFLAKEGEIVALLTLDALPPVIKNAYITSASQGQITIYSGGAERSYAYGGEAPAGSICDITVNNGEAIALTVYPDSVTGVVKRLNEDFTEISEIGTLSNDAEIKVYGLIDGTPEWNGLSDVIAGSRTTDFVISDGIIRAALIRSETPLKNIRVLISASAFSGYFHENVSLTSDVPYTVTAGKETMEYEAGAVFNVSPNENKDLSENGRITVTPGTAGGRIQLLSVGRNWPNSESPRYRGTIEIAGEPDGTYTIINEVDFEEYLYAVVPSEMPSSHGLEASKVQAVTARSYAYNQYYQNDYFRYGANVDDSVMCQVYNNIPENSVSIEACDETRGQCLTYGGSTISANFFSTSAGVTANSGEVWASAATREFPTNTTAYLISAPQYTAGDYGDLSQEETAAAFFKDTAVQSYDSGFGWFRWNVAMSREELEASINAMLAERYAANPLMIKTLQPSGIYRSRPITTIGQLIEMDVMARGQGGNITAMRFTGTEATVMVYTELNIRYLLRPAGILNGGYDIVVNRHLGEGVSNFSMMPSAFFTFDKSYDELGGFTGAAFYGGGYGHGVGMSQNGVKGMIDAGFTFTDILTHYYPGISITAMY